MLGRQFQACLSRHLRNCSTMGPITRVPFPVHEIDAYEKKRTDLLVQSLLNFGEETVNLDLNTAKGEALTAAIEGLNLGSGDGEHDSHLKKYIRSKSYKLEGGLNIRSWTMVEHMYRKDPCPFPTRARGLFTCEDPSKALGNGRHRIVARGYDKFFNVGEVRWTRWDTLPAHTKGPYHLTMKSNGCIIFISALTPTQLLVTSKHATETQPDTQLSNGDGKLASHARMGERWLERHLSAVGLAKSDLAHELWDANATAVAELTDDTFEEHVLATPEEERGLNLHGINLNHPVLYTYSPEIVAECAKRWGLRPTPWVTVDSLEDVKRECESVEKKGWPGRDGCIEGIVVRGFSPGDKVIEPEKPYQPVFWKVKFEEPYLMYREWRELTRRMLNEYEKSDKRQLPIFATPKSETQKNGSGAERPSLEDVDRTVKLLKININKTHNPESKLYVYWTASELLQDPDRFSQWKLNQGIVSTRERFLKWRRTPDAQHILDTLLPVSQKPKPSRLKSEGRKFDKTMLVPIAVPGCGKTSLGIALTSLFKCAHTQSDDIKAKKTGPLFIANLKELLSNANGPKLIFADKNNHLKTHREAISNLVKEFRQGVMCRDPHCPKKGKGKAVGELRKLDTRVIALVWDVSACEQKELHCITSERVIKRGENHQSLRPQLTSGGVEIHDLILRKFLRDFEEFDSTINDEDECFDEVINLSCTASLSESLHTLIERLHDIMPEECPIPTDDMVKQALAKVGKYKASVRKDMQIDSKFHEPRYFAIKVPLDLQSLISGLFSSVSVDQPDLLDVFAERKRFTLSPHVTLLHSSELAKACGDESARRLKDLWSHYRSQATSIKGTEHEIEVKLGPKIVWDNRTMAIEVSSISPEEIVRWTDRSENSNSIPHITVGTISDDVKPIEAGLLLNKACTGLAADSSPADGIHVIEVPIKVVKGSIRGLH